MGSGDKRGRGEKQVKSQLVLIRYLSNDSPGEQLVVVTANGLGVVSRDRK